jgi:diguanylate cyclase (GGDEF)-like protein
MGLTNNHPHKESGWGQKIKALLHWLTEPQVPLPESEYRRARVLSYMLLTLILLLVGTIVLVFFVDQDLLPRRNLYAILISLLTVLLFVAFRLNRSGRRVASARLTVACAIAGPWFSIFLDPTILRGDFVPLTYIVLAVLLTSMLLSARATVILTAIQFVGLLGISLFDPATSQINWPSFMAFIWFATLLGVVFNVINQQDLAQIERQTSQLAESEARLRELSIRDSLTGLYNRRYMVEALEREVQRAVQKQVPLSIIMMDIDGFKQFNDTYGHPAGDELLCEVTRTLFGHLRDTDIACRYGGDEFVLISPATPLEVARRRAEQLRECAQDIRAQYDGHSFAPFTLSLGVVSCPQHAGTADALLKLADAALYRAKQSGRNRVIVAEVPVR